MGTKHTKDSTYNGRELIMGCAVMAAEILAKIIIGMLGGKNSSL